MQVWLDPDAYAFYRNRWSPINPNFGTDYMKVPVLSAIGLQSHPRFEVFRSMAQQAVEMDLFYAITMPGGAGQVC